VVKINTHSARTKVRCWTHRPFFLGIGPDPTPGFGRLCRRQTAGMRVALSILALGTHLHRQTPLGFQRCF
jgi:hypothetical protein